MNKRTKKLSALLFSLILLASFAVPSLAGEWKQDKTGWWYLFDDHSWPQDTFWTDQDGTTYFFNQQGYMATGWQLIEEKWYYFHENGALGKDAWIGSCYVDAQGVWIENAAR